MAKLSFTPRLATKSSAVIQGRMKLARLMEMPEADLEDLARAGDHEYLKARFAGKLAVVGASSGLWTATTVPWAGWGEGSGAAMRRAWPVMAGAALFLAAGAWGELDGRGLWKAPREDLPEPAAEAGVSAGKAGIEWVTIPGGSFMMGSEGGDSDEKPVHRVTVMSFEMAKTEVTVGQYKACVDAGACAKPDTGREYCNWGVSGRENHPINCINWAQAQAFAEWAGGRLPTEAEWEYAARSGGAERKYPWGDEEPSCERAVMYGGGWGCGKDSTWPVCSKPKGNTGQGLCDMAGNVWEWVQDWYHGSYEGAPGDGSAWESPAGSIRVVRGGSWYSLDARSLRAADRVNVDPAFRLGDLGFRLARSP